MHQRINITLPDETLTLIDRVAQKGDRSRFIDAAVRYYVEAVGKASLKKRLKEGAIARAESKKLIKSRRNINPVVGWSKGPLPGSRNVVVW